MSSLKQITRRIAHAGALIFGAWWLVATSAVPEPTRECFTGIADRTRLQIVLDPTQVRSSSDPSCGALDGLAAGSTLVFDISKRQLPMPSYGGCFDYDTRALSPELPGVTVAAGPSYYGQPWDLTSLVGTFSLPAEPACRGSWVLSLAPAMEPQRDHLVSPLDAGPEHTWIVRRAIGLEQAQFCGAAIGGSGNAGCVDQFVVASITDLGAP